MGWPEAVDDQYNYNITNQQSSGPDTSCLSSGMVIMVNFNVVLTICVHNLQGDS